MAALLLDLGADIHATNLNGQTSLMIAVTAAEHTLHYTARGGHYALLKLLLHYKANIEAKAKHENTALHLAAEYNYPDIVAALIHKKVNIDAKNEKGKSPIEVAISKGHVDIVYQLKDAGAIIGKASDTILSLLNLAADAGQVALIKRTLDTIDKEEERRSYKNTSLHRASQHGQIDVVAYLLENGADIESRNEDGLSPLFLAGTYPEVVSFLIHRGACITARNTYSFKETALHHYTSLGHIEAVRLLLNCDSNIHISDRLGNTALHIAARIGHCEIADILLRQGVDVNAKNDEGETALHAATRHRSLDLAQLLIDFDIDIDAQTIDAKATALHYAMNMDNLKLVSLLAKTNFMDHCGMTPLLLAAQNWNPELVGLLLNCESFDCKPASTQSLANVIRWYPPKEDYNLLRNFLSVIKLFIEAGFDLTDVQCSMDWLEWLYPMLRDMLTEPSNHQLKKKWSRDLDSSSVYEEDDVDIKGDEVSCPLIKLTNDFDDGLNKVSLTHFAFAVKVSLHIEETYHYVWHKYGVGFPQFKRLQLPMTSIIDESQYQSNTAEEPSFSQKLGTSHIENRFTTIIQSLMNCVCARFITSDNSFMLELDLDTSSDINSPKWASHFDKMNGIIREPGRLIVQVPSNYTNLSVPGWHESDHPYLRFVDAVYVCRRSSTWVDQEIFSDVLGGSEQKMATNLHAILIAGLSILSIVGDDSLVEKLVMAILGVPLDPMRNPLPDKTSAQWDVRNRRQCPCDSQLVHRPLSPVAAAKAVGADIWRDRHQYNVNRVWDLHQDTLVANIDVGNVVFVTHRWSDPEINYQDWVEKKRSNKQIVNVSEMSDKLRRIRDTLLQHTQYVWMDTICIDKSSLSELDEVIRSMYKWYASCAAVVLDSGTSLDVWRSRGWCLQEGAAAGVLCGISKSGNLATIQELAMEQNQELCTLDLHLYYRLGNAAEVLARMDARNTTREEDMAYALAGIFSIDLTLAYGEGLQSRARLLHQLAIQKGDFSFLSFHTNQTTLTNYLPATGQPIYLIAKCTRASSPVTVSHFGMCFEAQLVKGDDAIQLLQKLNNWIKMSFAKGRFQRAEELIEAGKQIEPESSSSVELAIVHDIRSLILVQVYGHDRQTGGGKPIKLCYRLQCCQIEEAEFDRLFTWNAGKVKKSAATLDETSLEEGRQAKVLNDDDSKSDVKLERIWLGDEPDSAELHQFESGQIGRNGRKRQRKM
ncbi:ankyrin repeat-containing domain protein [Umbelopsis sp. AD052]|nr:ankyrin repeat-containing domain protein [Umbelopsis sp. AD052]